MRDTRPRGHCIWTHCAVQCGGASARGGSRIYCSQPRRRRGAARQKNPRPWLAVADQCSDPTLATSIGRLDRKWSDHGVDVDVVSGVGQCVELFHQELQFCVLFHFFSVWICFVVILYCSVLVMADSDRCSGPATMDYVSTGCSGSPHACAWGEEGLVAFASNRCVSLYSADAGENGRVVAVLRGHSARVNCVAWIPSLTSCSPHQTLHLVSGSVDKQVILWTLKFTPASENISASVTMEKMEVLNAHTDTVVSVAACRRGDVTYIASTAGDRVVCIWKRTSDSSSFECVQKLVCGRKSYALSLSFGKLPKTGTPILACACEDTRIYLWACQPPADDTPQDDIDEWQCVEQLLGHQDWVRTVQFARCDTSAETGDEATSEDLLLASGAQDTYVRIWRIFAEKPEGPLQPGQLPEIRLRENTFSVGDQQFSATLDAVLAGHEHWVYGVCWQPAIIKEEEGKLVVHQPLRLASASMDKTVMVWHYDAASSVWLDQSRMGDIGGNTLGFYGVSFSWCGRRILGHGYQGAFHFWQLDKEGRTWLPQVTVSGHFGPVHDIAWSPQGYLLSVSKDQTCRLHSEWSRPASSSETGPRVSWHEIARPQIHGYDLQCLALTSPFQYASGADEKVIRVFTASQLFLSNMSRLSDRVVDSGSAELALGATVPALGLSNKAVYHGEEAELARRKEEEEASGQYGAADINRLPAFSAQEMTSPPVEEDLLQNTLWPETQKLYGHSYEIFAMASDGRHWLASACKASKPEFATILLWDTSSWSRAATLKYHNLTITQLSFSHSGKYLLAVSRDRMWSLWQHQESSPEGQCAFDVLYYPALWSDHACYESWVTLHALRAIRCCTRLMAYAFFAGPSLSLAAGYISGQSLKLHMLSL